MTECWQIKIDNDTTVTFSFDNEELWQDLKAIMGFDPYEELHRVVETAVYNHLYKKLEMDG